MGANHVSQMEAGWGELCWGRANAGFCSDVISKELCLNPRDGEEGQPLHPSHTHTLRGVRAHTLAHMKHSAVVVGA